MDYAAKITAPSDGIVTAKIESAYANASEPDMQITLYQAFPKAGKMEYIIQKCTELGIYKIIPCIMERCVVKLNSSSDAQKKMGRYQSIAYAAAKQSQRGIVPLIGEPVSFCRGRSTIKNI